MLPTRIRLPHPRSGTVLPLSRSHQAFHQGRHRIRRRPQVCHQRHECLQQDGGWRWRPSHARQDTRGAARGLPTKPLFHARETPIQSPDSRDETIRAWQTQSPTTTSLASPACIRGPAQGEHETQRRVHQGKDHHHSSHIPPVHARKESH